MPVKRFWTCHFCGKRRDEVKLLIAGPDAISICDECVQLCYEIVEDWVKEQKKKDREFIKKKEKKGA